MAVHLLSKLWKLKFNVAVNFTIRRQLTLGTNNSASKKSYSCNPIFLMFLLRNILHGIMFFVLESKVVGENKKPKDS